MIVSAGAAAPVIKSEIPRTRQMRIGAKTPFVYDLVLTQGQHSWTVVRRYSEFHALHSAVRMLNDVFFRGPISLIFIDAPSPPCT